MLKKQIKMGALKQDVLVSSLMLLYNTGFTQQPADTVRFDTMNRMDNTGTKSGYWIEYLDSSFHKISDTGLAQFYWYNYFANGEGIIDLDHKRGSKLLAGSMKDSGTVRLNLLHGEYTLEASPGSKSKITYFFERGILLNVKEIRKSGEIFYEIDFRSYYNTPIHSFMVILYSGDQNRRLFLERAIINGKLSERVIKKEEYINGVWKEVPRDRISNSDWMSPIPFKHKI